MNEKRFIEILEGKAQPLDAAILLDDIKGEDYPYVIKRDGELADDPAAFILNNYGAALSWLRAEPHPDGKYIFRLVGFHEVEGTAALMCYCIDRETQEPLPGKAAIRWWPDAPGLPGEILPPASAWRTTGIICYIGADGVGDWGIGLGEAYNPYTESGVCKVWVASVDGPCDLVENWGYLKGTPYRHLAPIFERVLVEEDEDGEPGDLGEVVQAIKEMTAALVMPRTISTV